MIYSICISSNFIVTKPADMSWLNKWEHINIHRTVFVLHGE